MSYVKIWLHCVWSTKNRKAFLKNETRKSTISHIVDNAKQKGIFIDFINGHIDHIHALISLQKNQCISEVMRLIKGESSHWLNKSGKLKSKFEWQDDYFAVSVSHSKVDIVRDYIKNQEEHHRNMTWDEEVDLFLRKYGFVRMIDKWG